MAALAYYVTTYVRIEGWITSVIMITTPLVYRALIDTSITVKAITRPTILCIKNKDYVVLINNAKHVSW